MSTQARGRIPHERQHELIEETLFEIRGDVKWLVEHVDGLESRMGDLEQKLNSLEISIDVIGEKMDQVLKMG